MHKVGYLQGRRIQGDIGPNNLDPITGALGKLYAPAQSLTGYEQGILEATLVQHYALGSKLEYLDQTYRYSHADAARQLRAGYGCYPLMTYVETGVPPVGALINTTTLTLTAVGAPAADEFAEGTLVVNGGGAANATRYRIRSNTAVAAGLFTVTVYDPFIFAVTGAMVCTCFHSPWWNIHCMRQEIIDAAAPNWQQVSFSVVPNFNVPLDCFFWGQTKGLCICIPSGGTEGVAINERMMVFDTNGAVMRWSYAAADVYQLAGYILPVTTAGAIPVAGGVPVMLALE